MSKLRLLSIATVFALACTLVSAADVSGKWTAQVQGRNGQSRDITFNFTASGDQLTGTMTTPRGDTADISEGKISGNQVSFAQVMEFNGNQVKIQYKGTISDDGNSIEFTRSFAGGGGGQGGPGGGERREGGGRGGANRTFTAKRATASTN